MSFQKLFTESKGKPIVYKGKELKMLDRINLSSKKETLKLTFITTNSKWKQGLVLQTKGHFVINNQKINSKIVLWEDTAPVELHIIVNSKDCLLVVYNVWETKDGTVHYWHNGGAMFIEEKLNRKVFNCNDGYPDDDFNDLIFSIETKP